MESDRQLCLASQDEVDALVTHLAPECIQLSQHTAARNADRQEEPDVLAARSQVEFAVACVRRREQAGAAGSLENPVGSSAWGLSRVMEYFGDVRKKKVKSGRYFARPDLCQFGLKEPGGRPDQYWKKGIIIASTYPEVAMLDRRCQLDHEGEHTGVQGVHEHVAIRCSVKTEAGWRMRSKLSAAYPTQLCEDWAVVIACVCLRLLNSGPGQRSQKSIQTRRYNIERWVRELNRR